MIKPSIEIRLAAIFRIIVVSCAAGVSCALVSFCVWATCIHDNAILYGRIAFTEHWANTKRCGGNVDVDWERCSRDCRTPLGGACAIEP